MWRVTEMSIDYFDEESHEYFRNGEKKPSVTDICKPVSSDRLGPLPPAMLERASERGRRIHEICQEYLLTDGNIDWDEIDPADLPYIEQFDNWYITYQPKVLYSEFVMFSDEYCGTCDLVCEIDGETYLVDFKTTSAVDKKSLSVQLEGYKRLLENIYGVDIDKTCYLWLNNRDKVDGYVFKEIVPNAEWFDVLLKHNEFMNKKEKERN